MPTIRETSDAAASTATTYTLAVGQTAQGTISTQADHDYYRVNLVAGQTYTFAMIGTGVANDIDDTLLQLRNSSGTVVANNDDGGPAQSSVLTFTATSSGVYYIDAGAYGPGAPMPGDSAAGQYGLSMTTGTRAHFDEMMGAAAVLVPDVSWGPARGQAATVTWAARTSFAGSTDASGQPAPFSQLTASEIASVRTALTMFSDVANITFNQVNPGGTSNSATMLFSNYTSTTDGAGAYALYPGDASVGAGHGDVRINTNSVDTSSQPLGSYSFFAIMHEIGHAVGLSHPGDYNAAPGVNIEYVTHAQFQQDSHQYTILSYFDEESTTSSYNSYPDTLMLFDILAMQQLYGANMTVRAGNTIYGFGSNAGAVYDFAQNTDPVMSIWDAGGTDTLNAAGFSQAQYIDLTAGAFSSIGGFTNNVSIAFGAVIENANGGGGNDVIIGNDVANFLNGMLGNDTLNGGLGADTMQGDFGNDTYYVDNAGDVVIETTGGGTLDFVATRVSYALGSTAQIEKFSTTSVAGTTAINLTGNGFAQVISGNNGANVIIGGGGSDTMAGYGGNDTYFVDSTDDVVADGAGQGTLDWVRTSGSYQLGSNINIERLSAIDSNANVNMNLIGNEIAQEIWGNAGRNRIAGNGGADILKGFGGNDTFIFSNAGHSSPGLGRDFIQDFEDYGDDDTIDLSGFSGTLSWRGAGAFTGLNQVRAYQSGSHVIVQINSTGTIAADAEIVLTNTQLANVTASDFLL
jgi:serralysin